MAGLVAAIGRGTLPLRMAWTHPAMTIKAGFIQRGSARIPVRNSQGQAPEILANSSDCPALDPGIGSGHGQSVFGLHKECQGDGMNCPRCAAPAPAGQNSAGERGTSLRLQNEPASAPAGERRQLTVMFCDMVGSTAIGARLDPEDFRDVVEAYHRCVAENVTRRGGFVARYMGDGVLIYFGYPVASEDDAERAVRAGDRPSSRPFLG